jgi:hypothetical protein
MGAGSGFSRWARGDSELFMVFGNLRQSGRQAVNEAARKDRGKATALRPGISYIVERRN